MELKVGQKVALLTDVSPFSSNLCVIVSLHDVTVTKVTVQKTQMKVSLSNETKLTISVDCDLNGYWKVKQSTGRYSFLMCQNTEEFNEILLFTKTMKTLRKVDNEYKKLKSVKE